MAIVAVGRADNNTPSAKSLLNKKYVFNWEWRHGKPPFNAIGGGGNTVLSS